MGNVEVTADNDGLPGIQLLEMRPEGLVPGEPVGDPCQPLLGVGGVAGDQIKIRV